MSVNKNALIRYQVLDRCFRNPGRMYFWEDLLEECNNALQEFNPGYDGIQRRQLFDDIRFMTSEQGWSIPLEKYRYLRRVYYRYSDLNFSINNQSLNESEAEQIRSALQIISRFSGTPQFEWVNEMIPMLETKFGLIDKQAEIISFEENVDLRGKNFLIQVFNSIVNQRVLLMQYKDFKTSAPYEIIFHPHYLKQYNNRWFVLGLNEGLNKEAWNIALDRIELITETDRVYRGTNIEWKEYFFDMLGVTRFEGAEPQEVILRFSKSMAPYVKTKPIHPTQKRKETDDGMLTVRVNVILNYELESLLLSFGESVEVISPQNLRDRIKQRLLDGLVHYTKIS